MQDADAPSARQPVRKPVVDVPMLHEDEIVDAEFVVGALSVVRGGGSGNRTAAEDPDGLGTDDGAAVGGAEVGARGAIGLRAVEGTFFERWGGRAIMVDG